MTNPIPEHRKMRGRLFIPYVTPAGIVAASFRCIQDHNCRDEGHGKYLNPSGQLSHLYGVMDLHKPSLDICVAEGELNAITASEMCGLPSIGIGGADKWQSWWKSVLIDYRRVYSLQDGDKAGEAMTAKLTKELGSKVVAIPFPAREDVNSHYMNVGADAIRKMVGS